MELTAPGAAEIAAFMRALGQPSPAEGNEQRIARIRALEDLKAAASAAQARETVSFRQSRVAEHQAAGIRAERRGSDVAAEVALARRVSPSNGSRLVGLALALASELPRTLEAMTQGRCSEYRAMLVARETGCLSPEDRRTVDARIGPLLGDLSDRQVAGRARRMGQALDPSSYVRRYRSAVADRHVTVGPAGDMAKLTAMLPIPEGVACLAALTRAAAQARASGDPRSQGQLMADILVERVTGQSSASATPNEVQVVMTDTSLLGDDDEPARVSGFGTMPAPVARQLLRDIPESTKLWLRRLYVHPGSHRLASVESKRRCFTGSLRRQLIIRDEVCRTPYCDGRIKHLDHVIEARAGGPTSEWGGQGLCERCNYVKAMPGWKSAPDPVGGAGAAVIVTTPSGERYVSTPPPLPGQPDLIARPWPAVQREPFGIVVEWGAFKHRAA